MRFVQFTPDNCQHHFGEIILQGVEFKAVQLEKNERRHCADPFITVNEGMIFYKVEK